MSVLAEPVAVYEPLTPTDVQTSADPAINPKYTDEAALRIVTRDFELASAYLNEQAPALGWRESKILYQSPRVPNFFEGTGQTRANISRFNVAKQVNSLAPAVAQAIFSEPTPFQVNPRGNTTQNAANAWRDLISTMLDECDFKPEFTHGILGQTNQGTVIFKWGWETVTRKEKHYVRKQAPPTVDMPLGGQMTVPTEESDEFEVQEPEVTRSRPWFEKCELGTVYPDPKWNKPNQIWKARYICEVFYVTYDDLQTLRQDDEYDIPDEETLRRLLFTDEEDTEGTTGLEQNLDVGSLGGLAGAKRPDFDSSADPLLKPIQMVERWTSTECMVMLNGKVIIRNGPHGLPEKPYGSANFWDIEDSGFGMGVGRIAGSDQRVETGTTNAALDIVSHAVNPEYAVSRDANAPTDNMRRRLGGIRPVSGRAGDAYALIETPVVPADVWRVIENSREASESATGADQASVQGSMPGGKSSFGRSSAGASIIGGASNARIQAPVDKLIDGVLIPFLNFCWEMVRERMSIAEIRRLLSDTQADYLMPDLQDFMDAKMKFDTLAGARLKARQAMASALPFILQVFENPAMLEHLSALGYTVDYMEVVNMVTDISGWKNVRQLIRKMTAQEQQAKQAAQQNANPQAGKLQAEQTLLAQKHQNDMELEDQKIHGRITAQTVKTVGAKVTESPLDRASNFATRDQLERQMQQSAFFGGGA